MCDREQRHQFSSTPEKDEQGHSSSPPAQGPSTSLTTARKRGPEGHLTRPFRKTLACRPLRSRPEPSLVGLRPFLSPLPTGPEPPQERGPHQALWQHLLARNRTPPSRVAPPEHVFWKEPHAALCPESPPLRACLRGAGPSLLANTRVSAQLTPEAPGANGVRCGHHSENNTSSRRSATARDQEGRHGLSLHPFPFVSFKKNKHTHEQPARPAGVPSRRPHPLSGRIDRL